MTDNIFTNWIGRPKKNLTLQLIQPLFDVVKNWLEKKLLLQNFDYLDRTMGKITQSMILEPGGYKDLFYFILYDPIPPHETPSLHHVIRLDRFTPLRQT